jgi:hypothetical protein
VRARTGTLVRGPDGVFRARVTAGRTPDGRRDRPWVSLGTTDRAEADRRLARVLADLAAGLPPGAGFAAAGAPTVAELLLEVKDDLSESDRSLLDAHVASSLVGRMAADAVTPDDVQALVTGATSRKVFARGERRPALPLARETRRKLIGAVSRLFERARRRRIVASNPAGDVELPVQRGRNREVRRRRAILTDAELAALLACPEVLPGDVRLPHLTEKRARAHLAPQRLELKLLALVSRTEGGMRTGDVLVWSWSMIDLDRFASCVIPRGKTGTPQAMDVPLALRDALRAWWDHEGRPTDGPVFPIRFGPRAGQPRKEGTASYARRLRRDLQRALAWAGLPMRRELFEDTAFTRRLDFHSFRRAYATALARAGVTAQQAMVLADHRSAQTHLGYVQLAQEQASIPEAALPRIVALTAPGHAGDKGPRKVPAETIRQPDHAETGAPGRTRTCDRPLRSAVVHGDSSQIVAPVVQPPARLHHGDAGCAALEVVGETRRGDHRGPVRDLLAAVGAAVDAGDFDQAAAAATALVGLLRSRAPDGSC